MIASGLCIQSRARYPKGYKSVRDENPRNDVIAPFVQKDVYSTLPKSNYEKPLEQEFVTQQVFYDKIFGGALSADERAYIETEKLNPRRPQFAKTGATRKGRKGPKGPVEYEDPFLAEFNSKNGGDYMDFGTQYSSSKGMDVADEMSMDDNPWVGKYLADEYNYRERMRFNHDENQNNMSTRSSLLSNESQSLGLQSSVSSDLVNRLAGIGLRQPAISSLDRALNSDVESLKSSEKANSRGKNHVRGR